MSCPICHKPTDPAHKPFCSRRCAEVDLGHWLRNDYSFSVRAEEMDEDEGTAPQNKE